MKRNFCLPIAVAVCLFCIFSCKKSDSGGAPAEVSLSVSRTSMPVGSAAGYTDTFTVSSSVGWTLSVDANNSWITADVMKGAAGNTTITLKVLQGDNGSTRTGTMTIATTGNTVVTKNLTVVQTGYSLSWQKAFGGSQAEVIRASAQTMDGGYVFVGGTGSNNGDITGNHGALDGWVFKTDASGNRLWQRVLGGANVDIFYAVATAEDGGIVAVGATGSNNTGDVGPTRGGEDIWVVKLDANGNTMWEKTFGGSGLDDCTSVINTSDGFVIAGTTSSSDGDADKNRGGDDILVMKLDLLGNKLWAKTFGGSKEENTPFLSITSDRNYAMVCRSNSNDLDMTGNYGGFDVFMIKIGVNGANLWSNNFGGSGDDVPNWIDSTSNGAFVITGTSTSTNGDGAGNHGGAHDLLVMKVTKDGERVWEKAIGGSGDDQGVVSAHVVTDGSVLITGYTNSTDGDVSQVTARGGMDVWVVKLTIDGKLLWQRRYGGSGEDYGATIVKTADGGFVIGSTVANDDGDVTGGFGGGDAWVFKIK